MSAKLIATIVFLSISALSYSQSNRMNPAGSTEQQLTYIQFHVDGMNNETAKNAVENSINGYPEKIISWTSDINTQTIKIGFVLLLEPVNILELISATGYKPWYMNSNGKKVVLVGTNQTAEWNVKP